MVSPIVKPEVPYNGEIPGGLEPGKMCRLQGVSHPEADRFNINFQVGPNDSPRDDTALHISVRLNQGYIARNSYKNGEWGDEQGDGDLPIGHAQSWEIIVLVDQKDYKVAVNGQHFCEFPHRIPFSDVTHLLIDGDVSLTLISWEGITGVGGNESASRASQLNAEGPQQQPQFGAYGPPQGYGAPPQGYGAPPQGYGGYGPPGAGYGAPPQGYGPPPPPGAQPESGLNSFLDNAQSILAGAIKSAAAEKLLGGLLGGGSQPAQQGYAHGNAKYGIYPDLPQDLDPNRTENQNNKPKPGPVESILTNLLSGGNNQQQAPPGNQQQQQQGAHQQGLDLNSLLSGLMGGNQQANTANPPAPSAAVPPQYRGTQQQNLPPNQQQQGADIGTFLSGLLSGSKQSSGQAPSTQQQNVPGNQQSQGVDLGSLLSGLLSGNNQQPGQTPHPSSKAAAPLSQQNNPGAQQSQGVDLGSLLSGLLSGGGQQPGQTRPPSQAPPPGQLPHSQGPTQQSQGIDVGSLLSNLLSSHQTPQGPAGQGNTSSDKQAQNIDVGALITGLSGLLSTVETRPIQETGGGGGGTTHPQAPNQKSGGIDFGSLLSGLLAGGQGGQQSPSQGGYQQPPQGGYQQPPQGGYQQPPQGGYQQPPQGGYQQPPQGGYQQPSQGGYQQPPQGGYQQPPQSGYQQPQLPQTGSVPLPSGGTGPPQSGDNPLPQTGGGTLPQPQGGTARVAQGGATTQRDVPTASKAADKQVIEDVSDQLAQVIAAEGGNSHRQQVGQSHQEVGQGQYGQYPGLPQQDQKGPLENLLSGFLGGGQQSHQQSHPQYGGGGSVGGLGGMSGILENLAGNLLNPKDGNQRRNY